MNVIKSLIDTDLYKLTMQKAILSYKPNVPVVYRFHNRRPDGRFNEAFMSAFNRELDSMASLRLMDAETLFLRQQCPFLGETYIEYLKNYRFNPDEVKAKLNGNELEMEIVGPWERTILWEVPLMAMISELFFIHCDKNWRYDEKEQREKVERKAALLYDCKYADFGTRRRRNFATQNLVVQTLKDKHGFVGTSNVYLAYYYLRKAIGTMAHEWIMGISALESLRHANRHALKIWSDVFEGNLGIALTDTFGSAAFYEDFDGYLARLFDGVRHDSGDPLEFAERTIKAYKKLNIDPTTRTIVFSDGLDPERAAQLNKLLSGRIKTSYGIGTNLTNDYGDSRPLNMVIKMYSCNNVPVVKLSDTPTKATGDSDALRVAKWTFFGKALD